MLDHMFFQEVVIGGVPEFGGYNTKVARDQGHSFRPATVTRYQPLLDIKPADSSSLLTVLRKCLDLIQNSNQDYVIITNDLQLYKDVAKLKFYSPHSFSKVISRLGGMHMIMSFVGCIGNLMAGSGLEDILGSAFGGV